MMTIIKYKQNWNWKLCNKKYFTTIRKKSNIYEVGNKYLHQFIDFEVIGILVKKESRLWNEFNDFELSLDTGYDRGGSEKIFRSFHSDLDFETDLFDYMLFEKFADRPEPKQRWLFK